MKKVSLILLLLNFIACLSQENPEFRHFKVQRLDDSFIDVYHTSPKGKKKLPVLVFCQGSGYDSNTEGFLSLLSLFQEKVVGMAIEKRGVKYGDTGENLSAEYTQHNAVYNRIYDYLRIFQYLKATAAWWNGEVYLIGGSEGGLIAGMLASYYPNVKGLAIFSFGGGLKFGEAWPIAMETQELQAGKSREEASKMAQAARDTLSLTKEYPHFSKFYEGKDNTYAWWASIIDLRLQNALLDLDIPIFLAQGSEDIMAPPASAQKLSEAFKNKGKSNLEYKEYSGYDHGFMDKEGNSILVEVVIEGISKILKYSPKF
jgi:pimeloyl-ACP methyl ester carboxylesterase